MFTAQDLLDQCVIDGPCYICTYDDEKNERIELDPDKYDIAIISFIYADTINKEHCVVIECNDFLDVD